MYRHLSSSTSHHGLLSEVEENARPTSASEDCEEPLFDSKTLRRSRKERNISRIKSAGSLRLLSLCIHFMLVVIHLALVPIWFKRLEHRVVFALKHQTTVSFLITAITQTFGTGYLAVLVFITQKLSMRRAIVTAQPLTVTHDNTAAWAGIGSALLGIWHQKAVGASITVVLFVFLYLGAGLVLHITMPALLSLETFNSTSTVVVLTEGLPARDMSGYDGTTSDAFFSYVVHAESYIQESLLYLPYVDRSTSIGLTGGTLYDVPKTNAATGTIAVGATGFNVTCESLENVTVNFRENDSTWLVSSPEYPWGGLVQTTQSGVISFVPIGLFYSTIPIVDSNNISGGAVRLDPPMHSGTTVFSIQLFHCFLSLVEQTALLDADSKKMVALHPELIKNTSAWNPVIQNQTLPASPENLLLSMWDYWYSIMPLSDFSRLGPSSKPFLSISDLYLIRKLNLHPANQTSPSAVTLHDLENALSELVATMFWTIGHVPPTYQMKLDVFVDSQGKEDGQDLRLDEVENPLLLLPGKNTTATERSIRIRLDLNIIAVSIGLAGSVVLMLLSLQYSLPHAHHGDEQDPPIDGTGLLHVIWLYRNHPELEILLEQVAHPTDDNLRHAGMVQTRLVGQRSRETKSMDGAQPHPGARG